ncbi:MAG: phospholipid-binding protein MlaC [Kiloniellaceae bacterium]
MAASSEFAATRRRVLRGIAVVAIAVALGPARSGGAEPATAERAGAFLSDLTARAIEQLTDGSVAVEERKARFRVLFRDNFDVPAIGRLVLGRYWRGTEEAVREKFLDTFEDVMVERFAPQFAGYGGTRFQIGVVRAVKQKGQYIVSTTITPPGRETVQIDWRVRYKDGKFRVLDVTGQGVSMVLTLRSEYASVLKKFGGRVENLIALLRERIENQAGVAAK